MAVDKTIELCELLYDFGELLVLDSVKDKKVITGITPAQAIQIARIYTRKYKEVSLFDGEYGYTMTFTDKEGEPELLGGYTEEETHFLIKFGFMSERDEDDRVDLDKEKWDNYWGDFNQCGIHIQQG